MSMADKYSMSKEVLIQISDIIKESSVRGDRVTPLQAAVMTGNYCVCKRLLREGSTTVTRCKLPPPLFIALTYERFQVARLLIEAGASVFLTHEGTFPMFFALKPNTPEFIIEAIIKAGFPVDHIIENKFQSTALHKAVASKNLNVVKLLVTLNADCNVKEEVVGYTPMHLAINEKALNIAQVLVDNGADMKVENKEGLNPLFHAISRNDIVFVNFLLESGSDIHHLSSTMLIYPLHFAANLGNKAIVEALLSKGADPSLVAPGTANLPIHSAALSQRGKISLQCAEELNDIVELLIKHGSETDVPNKYSHTPMQLALKENNLNIVETLIKKGAALNQELEQCSNFHYVAKLGKKELISLFLEYGADHSVKDGFGKTPYHYAMLSADPDVLQMFWSYGYPFEMPEKVSSHKLSYRAETLFKLNNQKLFMVGIKENNTSLMTKALSNGAEARACSKDLPYPLHFAVSNDFNDVVLLLLENGVPANTIDGNGENPLHIAARQGSVQICRYLLRHGACYNLRNKSDGETPMALALENNRNQVICMLKDLNLMFKSTVKKKSEGLIRKFEKSDNVHSLQAYINSVNRAGDTLMAVALRKHNYDLAENLMKLRLQIIKA